MRLLKKLFALAHAHAEFDDACYGNPDNAIAKLNALNVAFKAASDVITEMPTERALIDNLPGRTTSLELKFSSLKEPVVFTMDGLLTKEDAQLLVHDECQRLIDEASALIDRATYLATFVDM